MPERQNGFKNIAQAEVNAKEKATEETWKHEKAELIRAFPELTGISTFLKLFSDETAWQEVKPEELGKLDHPSGYIVKEKHFSLGHDKSDTRIMDRIFVFMLTPEARKLIETTTQLFAARNPGIFDYIVEEAGYKYPKNFMNIVYGTDTWSESDNADVIDEDGRPVSWARELYAGYTSHPDIGRPQNLSRADTRAGAGLYQPPVTPLPQVTQRVRLV